MHASTCVCTRGRNSKSLLHSPLNSWLIDKDACGQIHMSGSADGVKMQVEIGLHSRTTRKNGARVQSMMTDTNTDMQAQQKEHTHTHLLFIYLSRCSELSQVHSLNACHYC